MKKSKPKKNHYVDSAELEKVWGHWLDTGSSESWERLNLDIYKICHGIVRNFRPKSEEEHVDLTHEAFLITMNKIKLGKLKFVPGKAPVFNLLTTSIFRNLYSLMNRVNHRKELMTKHIKEASQNNKQGIYLDDYVEKHG